MAAAAASPAMAAPATPKPATPAAKLAVAALYEGKTPLLTRSADRSERCVITQSQKTWTAKATLPGGVSGTAGVCARLLLELAEPVRPTSVALKNHGSAFVQLRVATAAQLQALKDVDAAGALSGGGVGDESGESVFGSWPVLVPWTQLCTYDQLVRSVPNKFNRVRMFKGFSRFLTAGYKALLIELSPFLDRKNAADDLIGLQWCCLYGTPFKGTGAEPPLSLSQPLSLTPSSSPPPTQSPAPRPTPPAAAAKPASASAARDAIAVSDDSGNSFSALNGGAASPPVPSPPPKVLAPAPKPTPSPPPAAAAAAAARPASVLSVAAAANSGNSSPQPLCSGHNKPSLRRVIRKPDSKDFDRSFYLCAQTPPCDFKHWADGKQYSLDAGPPSDAAAAGSGAKRTRDAASPTPAAAAAVNTAAAAAGASPAKKARTA